MTKKVKIPLFLAVLITITSTIVNAQNQRPNIIVFLVDDMGWQDTSLPFWTKTTPLNQRYHTPNMERMAKEGMKFTNAYAAPVCTPSRTAMLSGLNPAHSGITNWTSTKKNENTDATDHQFAPANWNYNGLSPNPGIEKTAYATAFPQLLKDAGYFTIHVGKAHWAAAGTPGANPYNMGFMVNIAGHAAGNPQSYLPEENYGNITGKATPRAVPDMEEYFGTDVFLTEALTREAIKALDAPIRNHQPFFLNMAHYAVHVPIQGDKRFLQKYLDTGIDSTEARYASLLEGMDKSLGDIMDFVKKKGIEKNTVIIFMSDNGGLSQATERGGQENTQNLPLKAGKGSVYEGGIREPMIVKYPLLVKPATITDQYVIIEDFFPTLLELAGIQNYKTVQQIDGKSFVPLLKDPTIKDDNRTLIWHYPNKWNNAKEIGINYFSAIRKGDWKLVYNQRTGKKELYNLKNDISENHDLATSNPEKVNELAQLLGTQLKIWKAPMPVLKTDNQVLPYPLPGQTIKVSGTIKNSREVLQYAQIKVKQTGKQVTTDADGRYDITVDQDATLQISAKGHKQQTIAVSGQQTINAVLAPDSLYLSKLLIRKIKEIEPYAHFLQAEKQAIVKLTAAYYTTRQSFIKDLYLDHPHVQSPDKALAEFLKYCKDNDLLNGKDELFKKAARTLGFELITDASPVNMESMLSGSTAYRDIPYTSYNGYSQKLDLFLPKVTSAKSVPCIVFIHDGAWAVHKRAWFEAHARYMAAKGYVTANIDYRMLDAVTPLQCVYDAKAAVRWVKANAYKFNIDTNKIGACGASAGAQLAAILATTGNDAELKGDGNNIKFSDKIQAAAGFATPTLTGRKTWPVKGNGTLPDWFEKISPYKHVTPDDAPMMFIHGSADGLVSVEEAVDMYKLYQKNGILTKLEIREGEGHVFYMNMAITESAYQFFKQVFN